MHSEMARVHHHFTHHHLGHHPPGSGLWLAAVLRFIGESMILVFLLIYLFDLGFSPTAVFGYGLVFNLACLLLNHWPLGWILAVLGPHKTIAVSNLGLIIFVLALSVLPANLAYLYPLAGLHALSAEAYIVSQHAYLAVTAAKGKTGKKVGRQFSAGPVGSMLGPLLGGLIAWIWSPQITSLVAGAFLLGGGVVGFVVHDRAAGGRQHYSLVKIVRVYRRMIDNWRTLVLVSASHSYGFVYQLFVLYVGIFLLAAAESSSGYGLFGLFNFAGSLVGLWVTIWAGRLADRGRGRQMLRWSVVGETILSSVRLAISLVTQAAGLLLYGFVVLCDWVPYEQREVPIYRQAYRLADKFSESKVEYAVCLENLGAVCRALLFGLACLVSLALSFETVLLAGISLGLLINLVFLLPPAVGPRAKATG